MSQSFERDMKIAQSGSDQFNESYMLPDGQQIGIRNQIFRCPELLFKPNLEGRTFLIEMEMNNINTVGPNLSSCSRGSDFMAA